MKKMIFVLLIATIALSFFITGSAGAKNSFLSEINSVCDTVYDCTLCHDEGPGGPLNQVGIDYADSGYDPNFFCPVAPPVDGDRDGFTIDLDCDDNDPDIFPGAVDICRDGIDQDCDGKDRTKGKGCPRSEGKGKTCSDGVDNDKDGMLDCADPDCSRNRACR